MASVEQQPWSPLPETAEVLDQRNPEISQSAEATIAAISDDQLLAIIDQFVDSVVQEAESAQEMDKIAPFSKKPPLRLALVADDGQALRSALASYQLESPPLDASANFSFDLEHSLQTLRTQAEQQASEHLPPSPRSPLPISLPSVSKQTSEETFEVSHFPLADFQNILQPPITSGATLTGLGLDSILNGVAALDFCAARQQPRSPSPTPSTVSTRSLVELDSRPAHLGHASRRSSQRSSKSHKRRGSVVSIFGFSDLGSTAPHIAPPALSQMSVGVLHTTAVSMDADNSANRENGRYLSASAMSRVSSAPAYTQRPLMMDSESPEMPFHFQSQPTSPLQTWPTSRSVSGEHTTDSNNEDIDMHPLYKYISTSRVPAIADAWQRAGMILLPPRHSIPEDQDLDQLEHWVRSHAFSRSSEADAWTSLHDTRQAVFSNDTVSLHSAPQPSQRIRRKASNLILRKQASSSQLQQTRSDVPFPTHSRENSASSSIHGENTTLNITGETLVYRRRHSVEPLRTFSMREKRSSSRLRAPRWMQRHSFSRSSLPANILLPENPVEMQLERVRLVAVDGSVMANSGTSLPVSESRTSVNQSRTIPSVRHLFGDIAYFFRSDFDDDNQVLLEGVFRETASLSQKFAAQFRYVKGYETYTAQRIRRNILDKIWGDLVEILFNSETKLFQMVENIVMGFMHHTIFQESLRPVFVTEDRELANIIARYRQQYTLSDFGLSSNVDCTAAIESFNALANGHGRSSILSHQDLSRVKDSLPKLFSDHLEEALTPFDILTTIRRTIDELVKTADASVGNRGTGLDDLLPLLAYTITQADAADSLHTLLFYVQHFTQSSLGPEYEWSLATFQAAVNWLQTDPLTGKKEHSLSLDRTARRPALSNRRHTDDGRSSPVDGRRRAPHSHLYRCDSFSERSAPSVALLGSPTASKSTQALVDLDSEAARSLHAKREKAEKHIPEPISTPAAVTCLSGDVTNSPEAIKEDAAVGITEVLSADMRRGGSESSTLNRRSYDWTSAWMRSPLSDPATLSPRSSSPAVSEARTDEDAGNGWFGLNRRRLSSVTSIGSSGSFEAMVRSKLSESQNRRVAKGRTQSVDDSALDLRSHVVRESGSTSGTEFGPLHVSMGPASRRQRPISGISLTGSISSASSSDFGEALTQPISRTNSKQRRSGRLRHDLLSSQAHLAPLIDLSSVVSYTSSQFKPVNSPIREHCATHN